MVHGLPDVSQFEEQFKAIALKPQPPCDCERCFDDMEPDAPFTYVCFGCGRIIPWCVGSDGLFPDGTSSLNFCNDCCSLIYDAQEQTKASQQGLQIICILSGGK